MNCDSLDTNLTSAFTSKAAWRRANLYCPNSLTIQLSGTGSFNFRQQSGGWLVKNMPSSFDTIACTRACIQSKSSWDIGDTQTKFMSVLRTAKSTSSKAGTCVSLAFLVAKISKRFLSGRRWTLLQICLKMTHCVHTSLQPAVWAKTASECMWSWMHKVRTSDQIKSV